MERLDEAAFIVVECSKEDTGIGRIIEYGKNKALLGKRPAKVICLYHKEAEKNLCPLIKALQPSIYPHVTCACYEDVQQGKELLTQFLT